MADSDQPIIPDKNREPADQNPVPMPTPTPDTKSAQPTQAYRAPEADQQFPETTQIQSDQTQPYGAVPPYPSQPYNSEQTQAYDANPTQVYGDQPQMMPEGEFAGQGMPQDAYGAPQGGSQGVPPQSIPPQQFQPGAPQGMPGEPAKKPWMGLAIAAFVVSFFIPIAGLILAIIAQVKLSNKENKGRYRGQGLNVAAFVISILWMVISVLLSVAMMNGIRDAATAIDHDSSSYSQSSHRHDLDDEDDDSDEDGDDSSHSDDSADPDSDATDSDSDADYATIQEFVDDNSDIMQSLTDEIDKQDGMSATVHGEGTTALVIDVIYNGSNAAQMSQADPDAKQAAQDAMAAGLDSGKDGFTEMASGLEDEGFPGAHIKIHMHTADNGFTMDREYDKNGPVA